MFVIDFVLSAARLHFSCVFCFNCKRGRKREVKTGRERKREEKTGSERGGDREREVAKEKESEKEIAFIRFNGRTRVKVTAI